MKPILKYPGAKWSNAKWVISHFPQYRMYLEPFFGSGAVFFNIAPAEYEVINDVNGSIVNLFKVIRESGHELAAQIEMTPWSREEYYASYKLTGEPLEDARRFVVRCWQAHGTRLNQRTGWKNRGSADGGLTTSLWRKVPDRILAIIDRLKDAEIENIPAVDLIKRYTDQSECLIYADPPYMLDTRNGKLYADEMTDEDHLTLLEALDSHAGPVVLSGYAHPLYDERLKHWHSVTKSSVAEKGEKRTEVLWLNEKVHRRQLSLFEEISSF